MGRATDSEVANVTASVRPYRSEGWCGHKLPSDGWQTGRLFALAHSPFRMHWADLFERATDYETTVETIRDCLGDHREGNDA